MDGMVTDGSSRMWVQRMDRQLREQFIHGLNDKIMLDKIIRDLMSRTSNMQMTSEDMLAWVKRVKAQRVQAAELNDLREIKAFDEIKGGLNQRAPGKERHRLQHTRNGHVDTADKATHQDNAQHMGKCMQHMARQGISGRCAGAKEAMWSMKWKYTWKQSHKKKTQIL